MSGKPPRCPYCGTLLVIRGDVREGTYYYYCEACRVAVDPAVDFDNIPKMLFLIAGFCMGLSKREGIALDKDERRMLFSAGRLILAIAKEIDDEHAER